MRSRVVWTLVGLVSFVGFVTLVLELVDRVRQGRGVERYTSMSGYEWNPVAALVLIVVAGAVLIAGGVLRWYFERREEHDFMVTVRERIRQRQAARRPGASDR